MSVKPQGHWEGYSTQLPPRQRQLGPDGQRRLEALLAKGQLDQYDRGALRALGRSAAPHDRARAEDKLRPAPTAAASRVDDKVDDQTIQRWVDIIDRALDADANRGR